MKDPLYEEAVNLVLSHQRPASRFLKEKLCIGADRAEKIMKMMQENGIVSDLKETGFSGSGGYREIIQQFPDGECKHGDYEFKKHGRCCPQCGKVLMDFGD